MAWKKGTITWKAGDGELLALQTEGYRLKKRLSGGSLEFYDHEKNPKYREAVTGLLEGGWKARLPES